MLNDIDWVFCEGVQLDDFKAQRRNKPDEEPLHI